MSLIIVKIIGEAIPIVL
ncbi:hypothetical protein RrIowa_1547 [Rickettsia rickettsii str. Iowa]|uniref:Uncharacterized protein n=1 Tax=Rickettsia rickettsii (strain Iowa) TaxID=452659 RepID=B0BVK5_RICRO|nr:hypothetical protein RrIowa_1547 [Rickettsia rickettsii str. Iowa]